MTIGAIFEMGPVQQAVHPWGEHDADEADEHEPAEEGIERCEQLGARRVHAIDGAHAAKNHRRVQKRIEPRQPSKSRISDRTNADGDDDDDSGKRKQHYDGDGEGEGEPEPE